MKDFFTTITVIVKGYKTVYQLNEFAVNTNVLFAYVSNKSNKSSSNSEMSSHHVDLES